MTLLELSKTELSILNKLIADEESNYRATLSVSDGVYMKSEWLEILKNRHQYLEVLIQKLKECYE